MTTSNYPADPEAFRLAMQRKHPKGYWNDRSRVTKLMDDLGRIFPPRCLDCNVVLPERQDGRTPWPVCEEGTGCKAGVPPFPNDDDTCRWCGMTDPQFTDEHVCVEAPPA